MKSLEKKFNDKDLMANNIKLALDENINQKKELKLIKKQE